MKIIHLPVPSHISGDHHCVMEKKNTLRVPHGGAEVRRFKMEGGVIHYLYEIKDGTPKPGDYVIDGDAVFGPYEGDETLIMCQGIITRTTDSELGLPMISDEEVKHYCNNLEDK